MKLSRLELFGFKSFAKKLDLKLLGGITAVVGPNGCGKTNVVDAIRWVLGEQRPTRIRLDNMEDVIFKGSTTRRQLGMAEVSLTIENLSGILPVDLPEVTITRRLFRSGESEYLINRKPCRLADINDLFMDTGMGADSYSMFEQNMINAILSDKTEDRRHIFEEAAGITKFKARRRSALTTLTGIEGDLNRLGDLIAEMERRVEVLKRQAARAAKYRSLKEEFRARTIALGTWEIALKHQAAQHAGEALAIARTDQMAREEALDTATMRLSGLAVEMDGADRDLASLAQQSEQVATVIADRKNEIARIESRLESLAEMAERARESARRTAISLERIAAEQSTRAEELEQVGRKAALIEEEHTAVAAEAAALNRRLNERSAMHRALSEEVTRLERAREAADAARERLRVRRDESTTRREELAVRIAALREQQDQLNREIADVSKAGTAIDVDIAAARERQESLKADLAARTTELTEAERRLLDARQRMVSLEAEETFLAGLIASYEGYSDGVRNAVNAPLLAGHVHGVFADLIATDDRFLAAVEAVLMHALQYVVVDTPEVAAAGVGHLTTEAAGRAVFLPLDGSRWVERPHEMPAGAGVIGRADAVVRTDDRFLPVVRDMLADVVIVDTLETAMALRERYPGWRLVTLAGELVGRQSEISGGADAARPTTAAIGRLERLDRTKTALLAAKQEVLSLEGGRAILQEALEGLRTDLAGIADSIEGLTRARAERSAEEARLTARRDSAQEQSATITAETERITASFAGFDDEEREIGRKRTDVTQTLAAKEKSLEEEAQGLAELQASYEAQRIALNEREVARAGLRERMAALTREVETLRERREGIAHSSLRTRQEIEQAEQETLTAGERKTVLVEEITRLGEERAALETRRAGVDERRRGLREQRGVIEQEVAQFRLAVQEGMARMAGLARTTDEAALVIDAVTRRLTDEFYLMPDELPVADPTTELDSAAEEAALADLRNRIHGIGDVNLAAEEEYQTEKGRLDFITGEHRDLVSARDALLETVVRINRIATARFVETFERIKTNFQETFREFFEGGVCDLELAPDEDPLEATIQITARPPGKNVRSINILSSGERALTAISLLFAIYLVKPSPFCILDEVDAPLDDANIDRFLNVIAEFSKRTQFIMVSHNKKTMARANNLYGITMEEPGLSTLVSVRFSESGDEGGAQE